MIQIFGDYQEAEETLNQEYLKIGFSPTSISLQERWRNNGLSADFLADYLSTFFPGDDNHAIDRRAEIKDAVSYIANELLENAMKFSYVPSAYPVSIMMQLEEAYIRFYVTNAVTRQKVAGFQEFILKLLNEDANELYFEAMLREDDDPRESGLGFLTMLTNYQAQLAWKFERPIATDASIIYVTTMVELAIYLLFHLRKG